VNTMMRACLKRSLLLGLGVILLASPVCSQPEETLKIGSKAFPESWVLGEACTQLARQSGANVEHKKSLGATEIIYEALKQGSIDVYPEYTGTIRNVFLKGLDNPKEGELLSFLAKDRLGMSYPLGFSDSYALAVSDAHQDLNNISDLVGKNQLRYVFNQEFVGRKDGWPGLQSSYKLDPSKITQMQHELAYTAVSSGKADVVNVYTTDAQISKLKLKVLKDDKGYFPRYDAVLLYRADLPQRCPKAFASLQLLVGRINEEQMSKANALLVLDKREASEAGQQLLSEVLPKSGQAAPDLSNKNRSWNWSQIAERTGRHLQLVAMSLTIAIFVGIPLGIFASRSQLAAQWTLAAAGLLQTIPSLALLAFVIPILGTGTKPALLALFIYSLLPIVRNTYTGLTSIPGNLKEAAEALGLSPNAQLWKIKLPMASPNILAGIKTSAVINVGTATLAALVGAGGLGESILQGISLLDHQMILQGAIPAAVLALSAQFVFDKIELVIVPRGLRL
jgi:osmoprotectant transport system permease protein